MKTCSSVWLQLGLCSGLICSAAATASGVMKADIDILERARVANEDVYSSLQSFVCTEEVNRYIGSLNGQSAHPLDTVKAKLSFERGIEQYSEIYQDSQPRPGMSSLVGAWSEGEYGTLLLQTQQLLATQKVEFETLADLKGEKAAIYRFAVPAEESSWDLTAAGHHYRLGFTTDVWISVKSGEILKIDRTSLGIPPEIHIGEIQWGITLGRVFLNGKVWLLPTSGTYAVLYTESRHREWNLINFSDYRRYGSQTALKFN